MKAISALEGGLAGAATLTLFHEVIKRVDPEAPRMDLLGMSALSKLLKNVANERLSAGNLFRWTLAGDILANSMYYSLTGIGTKKNIFTRGILLGLAAGAGALLLPKPLALNQSYSNRTNKTKWMTVALYLIGGIAASGVMKLMEKDKR
jgi:hypothetical protein